jgi:hypothetical protein
VVQDPKGYFIHNIRRGNFAVYENGVRQHNATAEIERSPICIGILMRSGPHASRPSDLRDQPRSDTRPGGLGGGKPGDGTYASLDFKRAHAVLRELASVSAGRMYSPQTGELRARRESVRPRSPRRGQSRAGRSQFPRTGSRGLRAGRRAREARSRARQGRSASAFRSPAFRSRARRLVVREACRLDAHQCRDTRTSGSDCPV